jgi:O-antigen ligase
MQHSITYNKWSAGGGILTLLASLLLFAVTGQSLYLIMPGIYLYLFVVMQNWKTGYWILVFTLPFSVQLDLTNTLSTSVPDEPLIWLYFLLFFLLIAANPSMLPGWFFKNPLTVIITFQFVWLIVSVIFSQASLLSLKFLFAKCWYLIGFFVFPIWIFQTRRDFKTCFRILLFPITGTMIWITYKHAAFNFSFLSVNGVIGNLYYNHVEYAAVISMFLPLLCIAFPLTRKRHILVRAALLCLILFFSIVLFLTYARAGILAVSFAAITGLAIRLRLANFVMPVFYAAITALLFYMAHDNKYMKFTPDYEHTYMRGNFGDHLIATFRGEDMSSMERLYRWIAAIRMSKEHPVTGYGPHAFVEHYKSYAVPVFRTYVSDNEEKSTTHNYFLLMLTEQGWPAMILYALLIALVFAEAQKIYHSFRDRFYKNCTMGVAMLIAACFINNFFSELIETHKVGALFYLALSLLVILRHKSKVLATEASQMAPRTLL